MASFGSIIIKTILFFTLFLSQTHIAEPFRPTIFINPIITGRPINPIAAAESGEVHDLLVEYGLPKGLLPSNVKSYKLAADGTFTVELKSKCYVQFTDLVYYDKMIKGKLTYGKVSEVSGIETKKFFAWLPITGMFAKPKDQTIEFQVGFLSEALPVSMFKDIPNCRSSPAQSI